MLDDVAPASWGKSRDWISTQEVSTRKNKTLGNASSFGKTGKIEEKNGSPLRFPEYYSIRQVIRIAVAAKMFWKVEKV